MLPAERSKVFEPSCSSCKVFLAVTTGNGIFQFVYLLENHLENEVCFPHFSAATQSPLLPSFAGLFPVTR